MTTQELAVEICQTLSDKKGRGVLMLSVEHLTIICDYFVIASGNSIPQVQALSDAVDEFAQKAGMHVKNSVGYREGRWVIHDFGDVVVHIFHQQDREFYDLERLWTDGNNVTWFSEN